MSISRSNNSRQSQRRKRSFSKQRKLDNRDRRYQQRPRDRSNSYQRPRQRSQSKNNHRTSSHLVKNAKLFVTNILAESNQEDLKMQLKRQFQKHGPVKDIILKTKQGSLNSFAFIEFQNIQDAENALNSMKGRLFRGKQLKVQYGKGERKDQDRRADQCYICHRQGHFARDCNQNRDQRDRREQRTDRDRHSYRRAYSRSSQSSYNRRHRRSRSYDRENRRKDYRHSPQRRDYARRQRY